MCIRDSFCFEGDGIRISLFLQNINTKEFLQPFSKLTDEIVNERFKLSHNGLLRIQYNSKHKFNPTFGLGFLNTGELEKSDIGGQFGIEEVKFIRNHNFLYIPVGVKINFDKFYLLPEVGFGYSISNTKKQVINYTNGETEKVKLDETLLVGDYNKYVIPISLIIAKEFGIGSKTISTGLKGYYGMNKVVKDVPRNNHYFGIGIVLALNL